MTQATPYYTVDEAVAQELIERAAGRPVTLLVALEGYLDAGRVGELVSDTAIVGAERLVTFNADEFIDYRSRRPRITFAESRFTDYEAPEIAVDVAADALGAPLLVLHGLEPDYRWERFVTAVCAIIERFGVALTVAIHGVPAAVPHTRPLITTISATRDDLIPNEPSWLDTLVLPAGVINTLQVRLGESGHDAMGIAVHVPHYLAQSAYQPAAIAALDKLDQAAGVHVDPSGLQKSAVEALDELRERLQESPDIAKVVTTLEGQYDTIQSGRAQAHALTERPGQAGEDLAAELERFLADQGDE
ncbi:PAC2 family protein [Rarobacter incanus]|uniref:PAC2 family protein n=1 Tax=Rarobacter incanus TaxID=153494 RepID=A0A542SLI6_9MICO|nr:PAC2 family protein [Rarobacter incanus]TQK75482.1 PAC2 family protein [Rarobacter incanus]